MPLFCDRPHVDKLDFQAARFVVSKSVGLKMGARLLKMGEEVPQGAFTSVALRQIYEPPLRLIETFEYAATDPGLAAAAQACGTDLNMHMEALNARMEAEEAELVGGATVVPEQSDQTSAAETQMCPRCGGFFSSLKTHTKKQCQTAQRGKVNA